MLAVCMQVTLARRASVQTGGRAATGGRRADYAHGRLVDIDNAPLGALEGSELEGVFHAWIGRSKRRYIFTIAFPYEIDHEALRNAVVVCACRDRNGRHRALFVGEPRDIPHDLRSGATIEVHYHLLATTPQARRAMIEDLLDE